MTHYDLMQCIAKHTNDVKSLYILSSENQFLSASRDYSVVLWNEHDKNFQFSASFSFHQSFINVVHYINPSKQYPDGLILSGGYDNLINCYTPTNKEIIFCLKGHTGAITCIASNANGDIVSGSSDSTALIWDLLTGKPKKAFIGHKAGLWSLIFLVSQSSMLLTASADKTIFLWDMETEKIKMRFIGHAECVRQIVELRNDEFVSCSNDGTVRLWSLINGSCLSVFHVHDSFLYTISSISNSDNFVCCGENGLVSIWNRYKPDNCLQKITLNVASVWCVSSFQNGDIIVGSSDGLIRIFTEDLSRQNGSELKSLKKERDVSNADIDNLPIVGIEAISFPGDCDGQLIKVSDEGHVVIYSWSTMRQIWCKVQSMDSSSSQSYKNNDEYVFSIDIKDGVPPLQLRYKKGQDPWTIAKKFLDDNDLSPMFLDQVAHFIINNTGQPQSPIVNAPAIDYCDPFTGASRYVPTVAAAPSLADNRKFPQKPYIKFDQINAIGLSKKVAEIGGSNVSMELIRKIEKIQTISSNDSRELLNWVVSILPKWENDLLFPLIDILRILVVLDESCNSLCFQSGELVNSLLTRTLLSNESSNITKGNVLTIVKLLVNSYFYHDGEILMGNMFQQIRDIFTTLSRTNSDKSVLVAVSAWFLNSAVYVNIRLAESIRREVIDSCFTVLLNISNHRCSDAVQKMLIAIGTLVCQDEKFTFRDNIPVVVYERVNNVSKQYSDQSVWDSNVVQCAIDLAHLVESLDFFTIK